MPLTRNPRRGKTGTSQRRSRMPFPLSPHRARLFDVQRATLPEEGDREREADRGLARRYSNDKYREHLAGQIGQAARERDQVEVDGVQHELDRHENRQEVPPDEHAQKSDREQEERNDEVVVDGDVHQSTFSAERFPRTTAPIMATRRNTEATSKGSR